MRLRRSVSTSLPKSPFKALRCLIGCVSCFVAFSGTTTSAADADSPQRTVTAEDLPRILHTEVADAMDTFQLADGFTLEIVATEPQVADPIDACFDEFGRMYVAEMHGYPFSQEPTKLNPKGGGKKDAGIIRLLEDTYGDGRMDKSTVFADKHQLAHLGLLLQRWNLCGRSKTPVLLEGHQRRWQG